MWLADVITREFLEVNNAAVAQFNEVQKLAPGDTLSAQLAKMLSPPGESPKPSQSPPPATAAKEGRSTARRGQVVVTAFTVLIRRRGAQMSHANCDEAAARRLRPSWHPARSSRRAMRRSRRTPRRPLAPPPAPRLRRAARSASSLAFPFSSAWSPSFCRKDVPFGQSWPSTRGARPPNEGAGPQITRSSDQVRLRRTLRMRESRLGGGARLLVR